MFKVRLSQNNRHAEIAFLHSLARDFEMDVQIVSVRTDNMMDADACFSKHLVSAPTEVEAEMERFAESHLRARLAEWKTLQYLGLGDAHKGKAK